MARRAGAALLCTAGWSGRGRGRGRQIWIWGCVCVLEGQATEGRHAGRRHAPPPPFPPPPACSTASASRPSRLPPLFVVPPLRPPPRHPNNRPPLPAPVCTHNLQCERYLRGPLRALELRLREQLRIADSHAMTQLRGLPVGTLLQVCVYCAAPREPFFWGGGPLCICCSAPPAPWPAPSSFSLCRTCKVDAAGAARRHCRTLGPAGRDATPSPPPHTHLAPTAHAHKALEAVRARVELLRQMRDEHTASLQVSRDPNRRMPETSQAMPGRTGACHD